MSDEARTDLPKCSRGGSPGSLLLERLAQLVQLWKEQAIFIREQSKETLQISGISEATRNYAVARYEDSVRELELAIGGEQAVEQNKLATEILVARKLALVAGRLADGWWIPHPGTLEMIPCASFEEAMLKWFEGFNLPRLVTNGVLESLSAASGRMRRYYDAQDPDHV